MDLMLFQNQPNDGHKFDNIIYQAQKRFGDPDPESVHVELRNTGGSMFSSSGRGGLFSGHGLWPGVGTRFEDSSIINPEKWKIYPMDVTQVEEVAIFRWCRKKLGRAYDWLGIIGQPLPGNIQFDIMWYCSEICYKACHKFLREANLPKMPKIRPGQVKAIYQKAGII